LQNKIIDRYYKPFKKPEETLGQTIQRVDKQIVDQRFKYLCNRDIIIFEDFDGSTRLD
jgi:hypothetical protein